MKIAVLGTGSWGTALAQVLCDNGHTVCMYGIDQNQIDDININHKNTAYFPSHEGLPSTLSATADISVAARDADAFLCAVPSRFLRDAVTKIAPYVNDRTLCINASKGFDTTTYSRLSTIITEALGRSNPIVSIIGPSHAEEVIERMITSVCAVSRDISAAESVQRLFSNDYMRLYVNTDELGCEYGAAIKNVIAIASGITAGQGWGDNAKAALVTRGLAEMIRYGMAKGGRFETFAGLTGVGDLVVTCFSEHSRNYRAGLWIGREDGTESFYRENKSTVEGIDACRAIYEDVHKNHPEISMPLVDAVYKVLFDGVKPSESICELMHRPLKIENR